MKKNIGKIKIGLENIDQAYSDFSYKDTVYIDNDLSDYLDESVKDMSLKSELNIIINVEKDCKEGDKQELTTVIKKHYQNRINAINEELVRYNFIAFTLLIIGLMSLVLFYFAQSWNLILVQLIEIVGWVFVWEFVDIFVFHKFNKYAEKKKLERIYKAKIIFK